MPYKIDACDESWDAMTPEGPGRHCVHCQKTVIDGTRMTEKEFEKLMKGSKEAPCVRLNWKPGDGPVFRREPRRRGPALVLLTAVAACASPEPEHTTLGTPVSVDAPEEEDTTPLLGAVMRDSPTEAEVPCEPEQGEQPLEPMVLGEVEFVPEEDRPCESEDDAASQEEHDSDAEDSEEAGASDAGEAVRTGVRMGRLIQPRRGGFDPLEGL